MSVVKMRFEVNPGDWQTINASNVPAASYRWGVIYPDEKAVAFWFKTRKLAWTFVRSHFRRGSVVGIVRREVV